MGFGPGQPQPPEGGWGRRALAVLDSALDAVVCVDERGCVAGANAAAVALFGWQRGESLSEPLLADVVRVVGDPSGAPRRIERELCDRDGAPRWIEASISATEFDGERVATLFLRDLTAAKRAEQRRDVEHRLARTLAGARSGSEIARGALEMVATSLDFDHAELWQADRHAATLRLAAAWRRQPGGAFGEAARRMVLGRGEDLAGMAWEIGEPLCVDDGRELDGLVRGEALAAEGIRACAALPVKVGGVLAGVGVFARCGGEPLDPELRQTLHAIGVQVRHFAERRRAERRLAEETVALAAVARATRELGRAVDVQAARESICAAALEVSGGAFSFLALPDPESGGLVVRCTAPAVAAGADIDRRFTPDAPSGVMRAFETRQAVFIPELADDPGVDVERARQAGIVSGMLQPIVTDDEAQGVLGVGWSTQQATLDDSTRLLLRLLAAEAGIALSRAELVAQLEAAARTDPLTGLANLRGWEEHAVRELAAALRDGRAVAVAVLDLDGFKALNDRVGHQGGDRVLRACSAAWQHQLRQGDLLARLGGDEFAALLPGCRRGDALVLAERLRAATQEVTASVGVAYWDGEEPYQQLMRRADDALYAAKKAGRDRVSTA
ncbi:MAG: sensor diguanylate cyclase [Solirubrobacterales bacterium]|nr:sensor diguanylate cyclase [Solirubrobacterales bacterium]